jgi:hypothetical protein
MRLIVVLVFLVSLFITPSGSNSKPTDFANFAFPWQEPQRGLHSAEWLKIGDSEVHLVNGKWIDDQGEDGLDGQAGAAPRPFSGLTLESVEYGDIEGAGKRTAIVVLRYDTGGTQDFDYVYIYDEHDTKPRLLGYFQAGDRAASGLYRVYAQGGLLLVELYDPEKRTGDCCSAGFIRTRYRWREGSFEAVGATETGVPEHTSRLRASTFGVHQ